MRNAKPSDLADVTQTAEEVGSTLQQTDVAGRKNKSNLWFLPMSVAREREVQPMELGSSAGQFTGQCWKYGRCGHKAADCRATPAS